MLAIVSSLDTNGAVIQLLRMLSAVDRDEFRFTVCCMSERGTLYERFRALGIPIIVVRRRFRFDPMTLIGLARVIREGGFDVIYTLKHTGALWGRAAAMLVGAKVVLTHENGFPLPFMGRGLTFVDRIESRSCALILTNSAFTRNVVIEKLGVPAGRVRVLYNGIAGRSRETPSDPAVARVVELKSRRGIRLVGMVGRLSAEKGGDLFLRSLPEVFSRHPDTAGVLCGDGPLREPLRELARDLGIGDKVHFVGWTNAPVGFVRQLDVLVVASVFESFCNVIVEAALAGVPVVAASVGAIPEISRIVGNTILVEPTVPARGAGPGWRPFIGEKRNAGRVDYGDVKVVAPGDLGAQVDKVLENPDLGRRLTSGAGKRAEDVFGIEECARQFEGCLRDLAGSGKHE